MLRQSTAFARPTIPLVFIATAPVSAVHRTRASLHHSNAGFSMVELVLSLGVLAFAFVSLLALLPAGMSTFHKAIDASVTTQISQRIVNEIQETDFSTYLKDYATTTPSVRYFDDQGDELKQSGDPGNVTAVQTSDAKKNAVYWVNVHLTATPTLPGADASNENLATVTVQIANNPSGKNLEMDANNLWKQQQTGASIVAYSTVIAGNNVASTN